MEHSRVQVTSTPLYDSEVITTESLSKRIEFFTRVGPSSHKTYTDTNMVASGRLLPPQSHSASRISVFFSPLANQVDVAKIMDACTISLYVDQKSYFKAPLAAFQNGPFTLDVPVMLESEVPFFAELWATEYEHNIQLSSGVKTWVLLNGMHARAVQ